MSSCTIDDKQPLTSSTIAKDNFSTLNGSNNHQNNDQITSATSTLTRNGNSNGNHITHCNHSSNDNLHKASDDEQEHIIPWRAQLRKTNSRLSLIG